MKKATLFIGMFSMLTVSAINVDAAQQATSDKKAEFEITENKEGTLKVVATDLQFGDHTLLPEDINAKTKNDSSVKITEFSGSRPGWTLKVQLSKFSNATNQVDGTRLFYPIVTPTTTTGGGANTNAPVTLGSDDSFLDNLKGKIVNDNDTPVEIAGAATGKGYGEWTMAYEGANKIQLHVPMGQQVGKYSATLLYTVEDTPKP